MKKILSLTVWLGALATLPLLAQTAVPPPMPAYQPLSDAQLGQLLEPIALYPDPLIAEILPAATLPTQIVLADRYVAGGGDPSLIEQQPWDESVQALAHYPDVLKWLDDNLNWTTELGQAFLNQQPDVMASIQRLRTSAQNFGNLQSTPQQQVVDDGGEIEILPADPQVIYVPVYSPDSVYFQSGFGLSFGLGFPIGGWLNCDFDWQHRHLFVWNHDHPRPANFWHERPDQRNVLLNRQTAVWQPENRRDVSVVNRSDRGWNNPVVRAAAPVVNRVETHLAPNREVPPREVPAHNVTINNAPRPEPVRVERAAPVSRPVSNGAFIGVQSSQATKAFSNRGQESMQAVTHSEPVSRPAPPANSGGGGGGGGGGRAFGLAWWW